MVVMIMMIMMTSSAESGLCNEDALRRRGNRMINIYIIL